MQDGDADIAIWVDCDEGEKDTQGEGGLGGRDPDQCRGLISEELGGG